MGLGDNLMATGLARGAAARGKRIAFGNGHGKTHWDVNSELIFRNNPNIAAPGTEGRGDVEWIDFRTGHRIYNSLGPGKRRWIWNMDFRPVPGEMYFDAQELAFGASLRPGFIVIEPNVETKKSSAPNKTWPEYRWQKLAAHLAAAGHEVIQFDHGGPVRLAAARQLRTRTFRQALAALQRSSLLIAPEGGMHHGAAAVGVPAVVLFGGFIPPEVTGYDGHINLTGGAKACGSRFACAHCRKAMQAIGVGDVVDAAERLLQAEHPI